MIRYQISRSTFWFRIFGYGLHFKDTRRSGPPLFSERFHPSGLKVGWLRIKWLRNSTLKEWTCGMKPISDAQLARLRETLRPTIEDWARDYGQARGKEHAQLENRLVAALMAMHEAGTITINRKAEGPRGGV